ncbi:MAG: hypothetical protein K0U98_08325 [Deltaproteobacteria bacterium]|nr:hypothetical protein [Deltaproteobacteria bacterium]
MNQDDQLLKELGRLAREQEEERMHLDSRWDSLSHDHLESEEEADLRKLAESSPQMRAAWEAFRPLGRPFRRRVLEGIRAIFPRRRRSSWHPGSWGPPSSWWPLAAAASLAMVWVGAMVFGPSREKIPEYSLEVRGGVAVQRSTAAVAAVPRLMEGIRLDLELFPAEPLVGDVALTVFLEQGGTLRPWRVPAERLRVAPTGSLKLELRAGDLGLDPGLATLWLAVSQPCCKPDLGKLRDRTPSGAKRDSETVRWMRQEILLESLPETLREPIPEP